MQTKHTLLLLLLLILLSFDLAAQQADYEWSWATRGGGPRHIASNPGNPVSPDHSQKINDIAIDNQNNYYFIADVGSETSPGTTVTFGNIPNDNIIIPTYNDNDPNDQFYTRRDTYLVSTDCEGGFRWQKTIGGGGDIVAHDVKTDNLGGVYLAGNTFRHSSMLTPVHYDLDSIKGLPQYNANSSNNKTLYIIKYDTNGDFQWLKEPQNDNLYWGPSGGGASTRGLYVEPDGTIHLLVNLNAADELENGNVVADDTFFPQTGTNVGNLMVLRYDKDANFLGHTKLEIDTYQLIGHTLKRTIFTYDPLNDLYYVAARVENANPDGWATLNGQDVTGGFYLAAFNATNGSVAWWHQNDTPEHGRIRDMVSDNQGNLYLTGHLGNNNNFAGHITQNIFSGPFVMKLDATGQLVWGTNPDEPTVLASESIALGEDEVFIGMGMAGQITSTVHWDGVDYIRTTGHGADPVVIRFDRQSGSAIKIHDIMGAGMGDRDQIRSLAVDKLGNIVAGGFLLSPWLFDNHPTVPQLDKKGTHPTDFFIAQLAKVGVSCDDLMSVGEIHKPQIQIFPNPAGNILHWQADIGIIAVSLYDISGRVVKEQAVTGQSGSLSLEGLSAGSYLVILRDDTGRSMHQVLIKK